MAARKIVASGRDSNPGSSAPEADVLTTKPARRVFHDEFPMVSHERSPPSHASYGRSSKVSLLTHKRTAVPTPFPATSDSAQCTVSLGRLDSCREDPAHCVPAVASSKNGITCLRSHLAGLTSGKASSLIAGDRGIASITPAPPPPPPTLPPPRWPSG